MEGNERKISGGYRFSIKEEFWSHCLIGRGFRDLPLIIASTLFLLSSFVYFKWQLGELMEI